MMDNLFNDMEQNRKLEEMEEELERQREAVLKEAMKQYQDAAMEGDPRAQYALARLFPGAGLCDLPVLVEPGGEEGADLCVDSGGPAVRLRLGCGSRPGHGHGLPVEGHPR